VTAGDRDGEIDLTWDPIVGTKSYVIEQSPDPITITSWVHAGVFTKSKATIAGLASGTRYWVPRRRSQRQRSKRLERSRRQDRSLTWERLGWERRHPVCRFL